MPFQQQAYRPKGPIGFIYVCKSNSNSTRQRWDQVTHVQVSSKSQVLAFKSQVSNFFLGKSSQVKSQVMSSQVKSSPVIGQVKSKSSHLIAILPAESDLNKVKRQDISNCQ